MTEQSVLAPTRMSSHCDRLTALRAELDRLQVDGLILATGDEHITELPAAYSRRLAWLTGFTGSTASVAILADKAAIFVDSRYTGSVRTMVDGAYWSYKDVPQTSVGAWLSIQAPGKRIGYDPKLYTRTALTAIEAAVGGKANLIPLSANPIDGLWTDQPALPLTDVFARPIELSGKSSAEKRRAVGDWLSSTGADACVFVALDSIAWLFNIRGGDVDIVPLTYSFAICHRDGTADLFIDDRKISDAVRQHLGNSVRIAPYEQFYPALGKMAGKTVSVDPILSPIAIYSALEKGGAEIREDRDPAVLPKAVKNEVEIEGMKQAHIRDGAALTRFLYWFSQEAPKGTLTELSAAAKLNQLRSEAAGFHSLAFYPTSAADGNAAIPHYIPTEETDAPIRPDSIYLVDSGGQYPDGTTDVTRTVAVGKPKAEVVDRFTRVLKGNIALQTTTFPAGTSGSRLDPIARMALWNGGLDFGHGVGHGVGAFLNPHEGPCYIVSVPRPGESALEAGMMLSNEPGYYKPGEYGIRIENIMVVVDRPVAGGDLPMLGFEEITMAPIDRQLIDISMLSDAEVDWLDRYHQHVLDLIGPHLSDSELAWLQRQTAPIRQTSGQLPVLGTS